MEPFKFFLPITSFHTSSFCTPPCSNGSDLGHDVYDVPANVAQNTENHSSTSGEKDPTNDSHDRGEDHHHMQGQVKQDRQHREPGPGGTAVTGFDPSSGFDNGPGLEDGPGYEGGSGRGRRFPGGVPMGGHGHPMVSFSSLCGGFC